MLIEWESRDVSFRFRSDRSVKLNKFECGTKGGVGRQRRIGFRVAIKGEEHEIVYLLGKKTFQVQNVESAIYKLCSLYFFLTKTYKF